MVVPTPTDEYLDITVAPFTANNGPTEVSDQHTASSAFDFAGDPSGEWLSSTDTPFTSSTARGTVSVWVTWDEQNGPFPLNQRFTAAGNSYWYLQVAPSGRVAAVINTNGNASVLSTSVTNRILLDKYALITMRFDLVAQTCDLFVNGLELNYFQHDVVTGSLDTTFNDSMPTLGVASLFSDSASQNYGGIISRPKFWDGTTLSDAEILEEFQNECASVVVPTPTDRWTNITESPFTANGSPNIIDDEFNPNSAFNFDKSTSDWLSSSVEPISDGATKFTAALWVKKDVDDNTEDLMNQRPNSGAGFYYYSRISGSGFNRWNFTLQSAAGFIQSAGANNTLTAAMGWVLVVAVVDVGNQTIDLYQDGVELSYFAHNTVSGSPSASMTVSTLGIASLVSDAFSNGFDGCVTRPTFWDDIVLSPCQVAKYAANEDAAKGEGLGDIFATQLITLLSTPY